MTYPTRLPVLAVVLAVTACGTATTSTEGTNAPSPLAGQAVSAGMTRAPVAPQATGHARMIADALSEVPLRDDQRAEIEKMAADGEQRHQAVSTAHAQVATLLAGQIESGALDRAALQPTIDAAVTAASASRPLDRAAMERLHALLTTEQRAQFVDAVESRAKSHGHAAGSHRARLEEWATDLKLTDDQRAQIGAILEAQHSAHHAEDFHADHAAKQGLIESFRGDTLAPPVTSDADMRARANAHADKLVALIQQVLPLLTPEQRSLAAAKIRAHAGSLEAVGGPPME